MKSFKLPLILPLLMVFGCASSGEITYQFKETLSFNSIELSQSLPLDRYETRELYLVLDKPEGCIRIDSIGYIPKESIAGGEYELPLYWVLERQLPGKDTTYKYTEIARNFDSDWKASTEMTFCTSDIMPIERLVPGTYRIRVTLFRKENYRFAFTVLSNSSVKLLKSPGGY